MTISFTRGMLAPALLAAILAATAISLVLIVSSAPNQPPTKSRMRHPA